MYIIRNDLTHRTWTADAAEARLYAIGGPLDAEYSVFHKQGAPVCLTTGEIV